MEGSTQGNEALGFEPITTLLALHPFDEMAVDILGNRDRPMSKHRGNDFERDPQSEHHARRMAGHEQGGTEILARAVRTWLAPAPVMPPVSSVRLSP